MIDQVTIEAKYDGYIGRQTRPDRAVSTAGRQADSRRPRLPGHPSTPRRGPREVRARPTPSLGQAGRISGISPADIATLLIHLKRSRSRIVNASRPMRRPTLGGRHFCDRSDALPARSMRSELLRSSSVSLARSLISQAISSSSDLRSPLTPCHFRRACPVSWPTSSTILRRILLSSWPKLAILKPNRRNAARFFSLFFLA